MNNIESNFVPYQIAVDMKSIGFDEPCFAFYGLSRDDYKTIRLSIFQNLKTDYLPDIHHLDVTCDAPLYQQAARFLYINSNKQINITINGEDNYKRLCEKFKKVIEDFRNL